MRRGKIRVYTEALIGVPWVPQGPFYGLRGAAGRFHAEKLGCTPVALFQGRSKGRFGGFRGAVGRLHAEKLGVQPPVAFFFQKGGVSGLSWCF